MAEFMANLTMILAVLLVPILSAAGVGILIGALMQPQDDYCCRGGEDCDCDEADEP
jgi:hypothetical protein